MKKIAWVFMIIICMCLLTNNGFCERDTTIVNVPLSTMDDIEEKLTKILRLVDGSGNQDRNLTKKLDKIIANQEEILKELKTIRLRSFR